MPLDVSKTPGPHTLVSAQGVFSQADLGDVLPLAFDVLVPSILFGNGIMLTGHLLVICLCVFSTRS